MISIQYRHSRQVFHTGQILPWCLCCLVVGRYPSKLRLHWLQSAKLSYLSIPGERHRSMQLFNISISYATYTCHLWKRFECLKTQFNRLLVYKFNNKMKQQSALVQKYSAPVFYNQFMVISVSKCVFYYRVVYKYLVSTSITFKGLFAWGFLTRRATRHSTTAKHITVP